MNDDVETIEYASAAGSRRRRYYGWPIEAGIALVLLVAGLMTYRLAEIAPSAVHDLMVPLVRTDGAYSMKWDGVPVSITPKAGTAALMAISSSLIGLAICAFFNWRAIWFALGAGLAAASLVQSVAGEL